MIKGMFMSDIHLPLSIDLRPVKAFIKDYQPTEITLGGDIIDAMGMHGVDSLPASSVDVSLYERDTNIAKEFIRELSDLSPNAKFIYLEGNHEERYQRLANKYPKVFGKAFNFKRDALPKELNIKWIPYGTYDSYYALGDTMFIHGNIWPDLHAKAYAMRYTPFKVVYGHLHHFQAYTTHKATLNMSPRYAVTAGCLSELSPDWKKGEAHQWVNGFVTYLSDGKVTIPNVHLIEKGMFHVGGKIYK